MMYMVTVPKRELSLTFLQMKKRGQKPDAQTFTILFRGLSWNTNYKSTLKRALALYQSMSAPNCPVKPSIIHTNVVLRVCARYGDTDALFAVAAKLPSRGPGAPDTITFTTILNAISREAAAVDDGTDDEITTERRQRANMQGRRLWGEIIGRVRQGDLQLDERLVSAMGRILLTEGSERGCKDLLSLVEQTMGVKRPVTPPDTSVTVNAAKTADTRDPALSTPKDADTTNLTVQWPASSPESVPTELSDTETSGGEFNLLLKSGINPFAVPGPTILSQILEACINLRAMHWAQSYWGVLTDPAGPYKVIPDIENYHMYLRLLRAQRASRLSVQLINQMRWGIDGSAPMELEPKTFRIAMSACVRDAKNPNVRENADKLARIMLETLEAPDIKVLEMYLEVASNRNSRDWKSTLEMLRGTVLGVRNLRSLLAYEPGPQQGMGKVHANQRLDPDKRVDPQKDLDPKQQPKWNEVTGLANKLIGAYDRAMQIAGEAMSRADRADCLKHKKILTAWVTRAHHAVRQKQPNKMLEALMLIPSPGDPPVLAPSSPKISWKPC